MPRRRQTIVFLSLDRVDQQICTPFIPEDLKGPLARSVHPDFVDACCNAREANVVALRSPFACEVQEFIYTGHTRPTPPNDCLLQ
jgi:hypothetical protein